MFMKKQQIVIGTFNFHHVILFLANGIPYSQAKRYRRITADNVCFGNDLGRLKEYFLTRNCPKHVIEEAVRKEYPVSMDDALKSKG